MTSTSSPASAVLLVSHGQPSDPHPAEASLRGFAHKLRPHLPGWHIKSATLALSGHLERVLAEMPVGTLIYPLFMSDGYFVRTALPQRLGHAEVLQRPPFGLDPALPAAVATYLNGVLQDKGWHAADTDLLLASHGSARSSYSQIATEAFAEALRPLTGFASLQVGYVEQDPSLHDAARSCRAQALCLPFFFAEGGHVREDVADALSETGFAGDRLPTLAHLPDTPALIAQSLRHALGTPTTAD